MTRDPIPSRVVMRRSSDVDPPTTIRKLITMQRRVTILFEIAADSPLSTLDAVFARKIDAYAEIFHTTVDVDHLRDRFYELRFVAPVTPSRRELIAAEEASVDPFDDTELSITSVMFDDREMIDALI